jgi:hypothetical protein
LHPSQDPREGGQPRNKTISAMKITEHGGKQEPSHLAMVAETVFIYGRLKDQGTRAA